MYLKLRLDRPKSSISQVVLSSFFGPSQHVRIPLRNMKHEYRSSWQGCRGSHAAEAEFVPLLTHALCQEGAYLTEAVRISQNVRAIGDAYECAGSWGTAKKSLQEAQPLASGKLCGCSSVSAAGIGMLKQREMS